MIFQTVWFQRTLKTLTTFGGFPIFPQGVAQETHLGECPHRFELVIALLLLKLLASWGVLTFSNHLLYRIKVDIIVFLFGVVIVMILNSYRHVYIYTYVYTFAPTCNVYSSAWQLQPGWGWVKTSMVSSFFWWTLHFCGMNIPRDISRIAWLTGWPLGHRKIGWPLP